MVKKLFYHLKRGKLMFMGKPLFMTLVALELLWERGMDLVLSHQFESKLVDIKLTAVIKTFERPKELRRLIVSIKRFYPNMGIIVVDDSQVPSKEEGAETITMPYDSGVSAGRNLGLSAVKTKYFLLLDDDFIFYRKTDLAPMVDKMDAYKEIDILGGEVVNLPLHRRIKYEETSLYPTTKDSVIHYGSLIAGMKVQDKVANFYLGRTERIKKVGWDERIKRLDHADFFTRAKGVLTTVFNPDFKILHAQTPFNKSYMDKRNDYEDDRKLIYEKYYIDTIV